MCMFMYIARNVCPVVAQQSQMSLQFTCIPERSQCRECWGGRLCSRRERNQQWEHHTHSHTCTVYNYTHVCVYVLFIPICLRTTLQQQMGNKCCLQSTDRTSETPLTAEHLCVCLFFILIVILFLSDLACIFPTGFVCLMPLKPFLFLYWDYPNLFWLETNLQLLMQLK